MEKRRLTPGFVRLLSRARASSGPAAPLLLAALGLTPGCGYEPGHDYDVAVSWLLNGAAPTAERCKQLGIDKFRLTMDGPGDAATLEEDCEATIVLADDLTYGGFQTSVAFDYGVTYAYKVEALNAKGKALYTYEANITGYYGYYLPIELDTVDVFEPVGDTASVSAAWAFEGGSLDELPAQCDAAGFEKVALWVASATDPSFYDPVELDSVSCGAGEYTSDGPVLGLGEYLIKYVALDDRGAIAEQGEPIAVSVDAEGEIALPRQTFKGL